MTKNSRCDILIDMDKEIKLPEQVSEEIGIDKQWADGWNSCLKKVEELNDNSFEIENRANIRKVITTLPELRDVAVKHAKDGFQLNLRSEFANMTPCQNCGKIVAIFEKKD